MRYRADEQCKKGKCKTCLYVWNRSVFYGVTPCRISDGLTNGMFGLRLRMRRCCRHSRSRRYGWGRGRGGGGGDGGGGGVSCFFSEWVGFRLGTFCCRMNRNGYGFVALS